LGRRRGVIGGVVRNDTTASSDGLVDQMSVQPTLLQKGK